MIYKRLIKILWILIPFRPIRYYWPNEWELIIGYCFLGYVYKYLSRINPEGGDALFKYIFDYGTVIFYNCGPLIIKLALFLLVCWHLEPCFTNWDKTVDVFRSSWQKYYLQPPIWFGVKFENLLFVSSFSSYINKLINAEDYEKVTNVMLRLTFRRLVYNIIIRNTLFFVDFEYGGIYTRSWKYLKWWWLPWTNAARLTFTVLIILTFTKLGYAWLGFDPFLLNAHYSKNWLTASYGLSVFFLGLLLKFGVTFFVITGLMNLISYLNGMNREFNLGTGPGSDFNGIINELVGLYISAIFLFCYLYHQDWLYPGLRGWDHASVISYFYSDIYFCWGYHEDYNDTLWNAVQDSGIGILPFQNFALYYYNAFFEGLSYLFINNPASSILHKNSSTYQEEDYFKEEEREFSKEEYEEEETSFNPFIMPLEEEEDDEDDYDYTEYELDELMKNYYHVKASSPWRSGITNFDMFGDGFDGDSEYAFNPLAGYEAWRKWHEDHVYFDLEELRYYGEEILEKRADELWEEEFEDYFESYINQWATVQDEEKYNIGMFHEHKLKKGRLADDLYIHSDLPFDRAVPSFLRRRAGDPNHFHAKKKYKFDIPFDVTKLRKKSLKSFSQKKLKRYWRRFLFNEYKDSNFFYKRKPIKVIPDDPENWEGPVHLWREGFVRKHRIRVRERKKKYNKFKFRWYLTFWRKFNRKFNRLYYFKLKNFLRYIRRKLIKKFFFINHYIKNKFYLKFTAKILPPRVYDLFSDRWSDEPLTVFFNSKINKNFKFWRKNNYSYFLTEPSKKKIYKFNKIKTIFDKFYGDLSDFKSVHFSNDSFFPNFRELYEKYMCKKDDLYEWNVDVKYSIYYTTMHGEKYFSWWQAFKNFNLFRPSWWQKWVYWRMYKDEVFGLLENPRDYFIKKKYENYKSSKPMDVKEYDELIDSYNKTVAENLDYLDWLVIPEVDNLATNNPDYPFLPKHDKSPYFPMEYDDNFMEDWINMLQDDFDFWAETIKQDMDENLPNELYERASKTDIWKEVYDEIDKNKKK